MNIFILLVLEFLHIFVMSSSKKLNLCPNEQSIYLHFFGLYFDLPSTPCLNYPKNAKDCRHREPITKPATSDWFCYNSAAQPKRLGSGSWHSEPAK